VLDIIKGNAVQQLTFMSNINRYLGNLDFAQIQSSRLSYLLGSCFAIVLEIFRGHQAILSQADIAENFLDVNLSASDCILANNYPEFQIPATEHEGNPQKIGEGESLLQDLQKHRDK